MNAAILSVLLGAGLKVGDVAPDFNAPDFAVGDTTLHRILAQRDVVVFFFPKAFTPG